MTADLSPVDIPRPRRKRRAAPAKLLARIADLEQERDGLLDRIRIAEAAALDNLHYAQAARTAIDDGMAAIMTRLETIAKQISGAKP